MLNFLISKKNINMPLLIIKSMEEYVNQLEGYKSSIDDLSFYRKRAKELTRLGLHNTVNYKLLVSQLGGNSIEEIEDRNLKAKEIIEYIKIVRSIFGDNTLLISFEKFDEICKKYKLSLGGIEQYRGVIPEKQINQLSKIKTIIKKLGYNKLDYLKLNYEIVKIHDIDFFDNYIIDELDIEKVKEYIETSGGFVKYSIKGYNNSLCTLKIPWGYIGINEDFRLSRCSWRGDYLNEDNMLIACPKKYLTETEIKISKKAVDPIVFQYCPYGVLIHAIWGEESEDKIIEEYKKLNNLITN